MREGLNIALELVAYERQHLSRRRLIACFCGRDLNGGGILLIRHEHGMSIGRAQKTRQLKNKAYDFRTHRFLFGPNSTDPALRAGELADFMPQLFEGARILHNESRDLPSVLIRKSRSLSVQDALGHLLGKPASGDEA